MLFNSYYFILAFLPATIIGFYILSKLNNKRITVAWLVACSFFFYGWWNPKYLLLIGSSLVFNFSLGKFLRGINKPKNKKILLIIGILTNLGILGYYKYANFFVENINIIVNTNYHLDNIILPLAISFFTFEQIAYIIDVIRDDIRDYNFGEYCIFVIFFPQLIAGPIVHHNEIIPQIEKKTKFDIRIENIVIGLTIFTFGLSKKVIIADNMALYATPLFNAAEGEVIITFFESWVGVLAYTFQIYFDFSGYSDMAIGLARLFGIKLPMNFNSPYKAVNIKEFWRRWHMTLSRFLRDYLYIPLGGNRFGGLKRYRNLFITMLLGGLWHGAGWTFIIWGALHGIYLITNHLWSSLKNYVRIQNYNFNFIGLIFSKLITFLCVMIAWIFFRAESIDGAMRILQSLIGRFGFSLPLEYLDKLGEVGYTIRDLGVEFIGVRIIENVPIITGMISLVIVFIFILFAPNTQEIMIRYEPGLEIYKGELGGQSRINWGVKKRWATIVGCLFLISFIYLGYPSEFIYYNF